MEKLITFCVLSIHFGVSTAFPRPNEYNDYGQTQYQQYANFAQSQPNYRQIQPQQQNYEIIGRNAEPDVNANFYNDALQIQYPQYPVNEPRYVKKNNQQYQNLKESNIREEIHEQQLRQAITKQLTQLEAQAAFSQTNLPGRNVAEQYLNVAPILSSPTSVLFGEIGSQAIAGREINKNFINTNVEPKITPLWSQALPNINTPSTQVRQPEKNQSSKRYAVILKDGTKEYYDDIEIIRLKYPKFVFAGANTPSINSQTTSVSTSGTSTSVLPSNIPVAESTSNIVSTAALSSSAANSESINSVAFTSDNAATIGIPSLSPNVKYNNAQTFLIPEHLDVLLPGGEHISSTSQVHQIDNTSTASASSASYITNGSTKNDSNNEQGVSSAASTATTQNSNELSETNTSVSTSVQSSTAIVNDDIHESLNESELSRTDSVVASQQSLSSSSSASQATGASSGRVIVIDTSGIQSDRGFDGDSEILSQLIGDSEYALIQFFMFPSPERIIERSVTKVIKKDGSVVETVEESIKNGEDDEPVVTKQVNYYPAKDNTNEDDISSSENENCN